MAVRSTVRNAKIIKAVCSTQGGGRVTLIYFSSVARAKQATKKTTTVWQCSMNACLQKVFFFVFTYVYLYVKKNQTECRS